MRISDVMDELGQALSVIDNPKLKVYAWPYGKVPSPPSAVIGYPTSYEFDETYGRGMDKATFPVVVMLARPYDRQTRDQLSALISGSGTRSVKAALESGTYTAFDTIHAASVDMDVIADNSTPYLAAVFEVIIAGSGN